MASYAIPPQCYGGCCDDFLSGQASIQNTKLRWHETPLSRIIDFVECGAMTIYISVPA